MTRTRFPIRGIPQLLLWVLLLTGLNLVLGGNAVSAQNNSKLSATAQTQPAAAQAQNNPFCEPSAQTQAAMKELQKLQQKPNETDYENWHARLTALQALVKRYPNDFFVEQRYVYFMKAPDPSTNGWPSELDQQEVVAQYKALHEKHPDDAIIDDLYATTLIDRDTPAAIKLLDEALQKNPSFPWPNMDLVRIYTSPNFRDPAKAASHLKAFMAACPASLNSYTWVASVGDKEFSEKSAAGLLKIIATRTDAEALSMYPMVWRIEYSSHPSSDYPALQKQMAGDIAHIRGLNLEKTFSLYPQIWAMEFRIHPPADYAAVRKQVAADLARIRALNLAKEAPWWRTLNQGYQLTGDQKQAQWAEAGWEKHVQIIGGPARKPEVAAWFGKHPRPSPNASEAKRQKYFREELEVTDQWIRKYPNSRQVWNVRMNAMEQLDDVPVAECAATLKKIYQLDEVNNGPLPLYWWTYFQYADFLSQKKADPALEVELAQKGLQTIAAEWESVPIADTRGKKDDYDYYPNFYWPFMKAHGLLYEAEGYTRLKEPDKALDALRKVNLQLQALNEDINADKSRAQLQDRDGWYHRGESQYWQAKARVAELQGRNTDAMAYYQSALLARLKSDRIPSPGQKDELADEAHALWTKLGGTEGGWNTWYVQRASLLATNRKAPVEWETADQRLPAFQLADLKGKTWQLSDLRGKVVVLNFWATW